MTLRGFMALRLRHFAPTFVIQGVGALGFSRSVAVCALNAFLFDALRFWQFVALTVCRSFVSQFWEFVSFTSRGIHDSWLRAS